MGEEGDSLVICKKLKFDHTNKWYMHNPKSDLENETHKRLWDFEINTNHLILARQPDHIIINKTERTCRVVDFAVTADHWVKLKENERKDQYTDLARDLRKTVELEPIIPIVIDALSTVTKGLIQGLEDLKIRGRVETI